MLFQVEEPAMHLLENYLNGIEKYFIDREDGVVIGIAPKKGWGRIVALVVITIALNFFLTTLYFLPLHSRRMIIPSPQESVTSIEYETPIEYETNQ